MVQVIKSGNTLCEQVFKGQSSSGCDGVRAREWICVKITLAEAEFGVGGFFIEYFCQEESNIVTG